MSTATATKRSSTAKATEAKLNHTFPDGTSFNGTFEQLQKVASALGMKITGISVCPRGYYTSESKGLVKISEMNDYHIRRALLKRSKDYFAEIFDKDDTNREFIQKYSQLLDDQTVFDLCTELTKRF
jgi:hypothetical protein